MKKNKAVQHKLNPDKFPGRVRIIGGQLRGRFIELPLQHNIRPTTNINRESVFNWLGNHIVAANCLDVFAGSGALGVEALSRGASTVTFIDSDPIVLKNIAAHLKKFFKTDDIDACAKFIHLSIPTAMMPAFAGTAYDVIFVDPPFYHGLAPLTLGWLAQQHLVKNDSLVFLEVEASAPLTLLEPSWHIIKQKLRSSVYAYLLRYHPATI